MDGELPLWANGLSLLQNKPALEFHNVSGSRWPMYSTAFSWFAARS
jgi:hypothetical protein